MPVPATLTSYLPVLLVGVTNHAVPDDSAFSTQPEGQVDYLSHEWREEDVWRSWRSMTRQKNAIANGMRLENASWRTWWKQRNKLKTISPETLNWLKDSDVTWLYGPLHTGSDWSHSNQQSQSHSSPQRKGSTDSTALATPAGKKPILKRRSISQLLSLPVSPFFDRNDSEEEESLQSQREHGTNSPSRPPLLHTKSDTHLTWRSRPFRKDSPPRIIASDHPGTDYLSTAATTSSDSSGSTGSEQDLITAAATVPVGGKKKHISFNTFVEQCIAIEKPKPKRRGSMHGRAPYFARSEFDDGYDEDSEFGEDDEYDEPSSFYLNNSAGVDSDSEDEDDVLEIRSRRSRSSSSSRSHHTPSALSTRPRPRPPIVRQSSIDREHVTIAPIAPTILKTTGVGNHLVSIDEDPVPAPKEVELVYVPPQHSIYSLPGTPSLHAEDVYHHRESYFSVGTSSPAVSHHQSLSADSSPAIPSFGASAPVPEALIRSRSSSHTDDLNQFFAQQPVYRSPVPADEVREDAYDYFGGPDLGEDFSDRRAPASRRRRNFPDVKDDDDHSGGGVLRYGQGGASSVHNERSSSTDNWSPPVSASPRIVVNEVAGVEEERKERSRENSPPTTREVPIPRKAEMRIDPDIPLGVSYVHCPAIPVPVPRTASPSSMAKESPINPSLLSPREPPIPIRGRSPQRSPVSGSTTTGSYTHSSDSRSESRGRSSTRNSSYSDRERSGSRSSRGTNSPLGSISPTGSAVGIGGVYSGRGRDKDNTRAKMYRKGEERGRDRTGRRIGDSLSPPSVLSSPTTPNDDQPSYPSIFEAKPTNISPPASVCGSTVSGSSTASAATVVPNGTLPNGTQGGAESEGLRARINIPMIPSPIPEEEETRSRQPTPANSPVRALASPQPPLSPPPTSHSHSGSPLQVTPPAKSRPSEPVTSPSEAKATPPGSPTAVHTTFRNPRSPERHSRGGSEFQEHTHAGTLVGRAAEIVQSARGFFNAMWNSGSSSSS